VTTGDLVLKFITCGYQIEIDGLVISYCPDTGYCKNAIALSRGADLLITEFAFKSGCSNPDWPYLNPEIVAWIAYEAETA
jgi:ribonuclease BN (tRNA processing enzyme)